MSLRKINDVKIKPLKVPVIKTEDIKGGELFPELYFTAYLIAPPRSGKTTTVFNILKNIMNKKTEFYGFVGTHNSDASYEIFKKWFEKKDIDYEFHANIKKGKIHYLAALIHKFKTEDADIEKDDKEKKKKYKVLEDDEEKVTVRIYKPKKESPKRVILFDDMSIDLRDPYVNEIIKEFRHFKCVVLISSQAVYDIEPASRASLNYYLLFKGIDDSKLMDVYEKLGISIGFDLFLRMYKNATEDKYCFLYVSKNGEFRKCFSEKYDI